MKCRIDIYKIWKDRMKLMIQSISLLFLYLLGTAQAQDLLNSGQINNSGTFRIKNQALGLHDSIGGVFDYFGISQTMPAIQYRNLVLSGSGVKRTTAGDFAVLGNVTIGETVTLQVEDGFTLKMEGRLTENGYLRGRISKIVDLAGIVTSSDFGNIGATIGWSGITPGSTTTIRTSGLPQTGKGNESILRYYDIISVTSGGLSANLFLKYSDNELNGNDPAKLLLWKSIDSGKTWKVQGGSLDTASRAISKRGITSFGRFAMADSLHPLGSLRQSTGLLAITSGNQQSRPINSTLLPFIISVRDSEGVPFDGESVIFNIIESPGGASGQALSQTAVQTDSDGFASTILTLGNKVGNYLVAASFAGGNGVPVVFTASAYSGVAASMQGINGNNQSQDIGTVLPNPFTVSVTDAGGNPVYGANVRFSISEAPVYSVGHVLSDTIATTDSLGRATTILKLGSRYGDYEVTAIVPGLSGDPVIFKSSATAFIADANGDKSANIGDLTTVFDKVLERIELTPENFTRADVDSNNSVDVRDAVIILGGLLNGRWDSAAVVNRRAQSIADSYKCEFEITSRGLRFNLENNMPVKGIQIALKFNKQVSVTGPDPVFNRAKQMQVPMQQDGDIVRIVINNNENLPVDPGSGSVFRLPLENLTLNDFEILYVIVSTMANEGIQVQAQKVLASSDKYPATFALDQNYPNPFNGETKIRFHVPDDLGATSNILIQIFDISGKKVRTLVKGEFEAGHYTSSWDGRNDDGKTVSSGAYLYRVSAKDRILVKRMMFVK